jgi:hypothetical protein
LRVPYVHVVLVGPTDEVASVGRETYITLAWHTVLAARCRPGWRGIGFAVAECPQVAIEGVEEEVPLAVCCQEDAFPVIRKFDLRPISADALGGEFLLEFEQVEGREGGLVVVPEVVEEDGGCGGGGDCDYRGGRIKGREVGGIQDEFAVGVGGVEGPEEDSVVDGAGKEFVAAGGDGEASYGGGVTFEVAEKEVVVS